MSTLLPLDAETLPRSLVLDPPMSDTEFEALCRANDSVHFERTKEGVIQMNPPPGGFTTRGNGEINRQLGNWWVERERSWFADSSGGFYLPDGSMLSPDAAYVSPEKVDRLTDEQLAGFLPVCPDFVIELLSGTDSLLKTKQKMERWIANGVHLGWLIDPYQKKVFVYQPGADPESVSANLIEGTGHMEDFVLDLNRVWRCYRR